MPVDVPRVYWDSNVLLSYVDGDQDRLPTIEELLRRGRAREIELVTSAMSQVEVAFAGHEKDEGTLDREVDASIEELWSPASPIALVEFHPALAREARQLIREAVAADSRPSLKPADAIYLATASRMRVKDFHTYDAKLHAQAGAFPFPIREPLTPQPQLPGT